MKDSEQLRQESKEIKDKIDHTEERLRQLKNQEKKILKQDTVKKKKRKNSQANNKKTNLRKPYRKCRRTNR